MDSLMCFLHALNSQRTSIKLTWNISKFEVNFLDLSIAKDMDCMADQVQMYIRTYEKPMNKYLYIPYSSFHSKSVLKGFIKSRLINYVVTCSRESDFMDMRCKFRTRLLERAYPPAFIDQVFMGVCFGYRQQYLDVKKETDDLKLTSLFIDYSIHTGCELHLKNIISNVHEKFLDNTDIQTVTGGIAPLVVYTKGKSLHSLLVNAKH